MKASKNFSSISHSKISAFNVSRRLPRVLRGVSISGALICTHLIFFLVSGAISQDFTKQDSGWVPLFNGVDFEGLYSRMYNRDVTDEPDRIFTIVDSTIHVASGGGHIGTDKDFSHYRMRVDYKYAGTNPGDNAGLMYHITEDWPRMSNSWPRSIECQMKKNETGDAFSIQDVTYDIPVNPGDRGQYQPGSQTMTTSWSQNYRQVHSLSRTEGNPYKEGEWNTMELVVRGADSAEHIVAGRSLLKLYNIRIPDPNNGNNEVPWGEGKIAVQAESAEISYRRWEIMELDPNGPDYQQKLFLTTPEEGDTVTSGETLEITWKHIGDFSEVNIEYSLDDGDTWEEVKSDAPNNGRYQWETPELNSAIKIRLSAEEWVTPAVSEEFYIDTPVPVSQNTFQVRSIHLYSDGVLLAQAKGAYTSIQIANLKGEVLRYIPIESGIVRWDGRDAAGMLIPTGVYFGLFTGQDTQTMIKLFNRD